MYARTSILVVEILSRDSSTNACDDELTSSLAQVCDKSFSVPRMPQKYVFLRRIRILRRMPDEFRSTRKEHQPC